jgi:hypothetical protein
LVRVAAGHAQRRLRLFAARQHACAGQDQAGASCGLADGIVEKTGAHAWNSKLLGGFYNTQTMMYFF